MAGCTADVWCDFDAQIRTTAFEWLRSQTAAHGDELPRSVFSDGFNFCGVRVPLIGPQGVFKPPSACERRILGHHMGFRALTVAVVLLGWALPLRAQQSVALQFNDGHVTLTAQNAPVRVILAEWARLGGATIVNGDRVAGPPVTLELAAVPERQALDIVLRGVAGYMLAPRQAGSDSTSTFDRIVILPTSVAPKNPPPPALTAGTPRGRLPRPSAVFRRPGTAVVGAPEPVASGQPPAGGTRVVVPRPPRVTRQPPGPGAQPSDPDGAPDDVEEPREAPPAAVEPTPTNPFGIPRGSSARPGVVTPVPQPQQQPAQNRVQ